MFTFQQLGYALSPLLSAVVAEAAEPLGLFDRDKELSKFVMTNASTPEALAEAQELWLSATISEVTIWLAVAGAGEVVGVTRPRCCVHMNSK